MAKLMANSPSPINYNVRIVNEQGQPTQEFMRWLTDQFQSNATAESAQAAADSAQSSVDAVKTINLISGTALGGGGDLSGPDRTFKLEDTAVTAGDYGDAANVPQVTIDAQGRITSAANVPVSGGGGGESFTWPNDMDDTINGTGAAFKGVLFLPNLDFDISQIAVLLNTINGATYRAGVYRLDSSDNIDELTGVSADFTAASSETPAILKMDLTASLLVGSRYVAMIGRTDDTATYVLPVLYESGASDTHYPSIPTQPFPNGATNASMLARTTTTTSPAIGTHVSIISGFDSYALGFRFSLA